jgi:hypothetical protein
MHIPENCELYGVPPYLESWIVAKVPKFVPAILSRWERNGISLSEHFFLLLCPLAEINSHGGLPEGVQLLTDPRLTCRHFTGCHRPYFAALFLGETAESVCQDVLERLPWSEAYEVELGSDRIGLHFFGATEDIDEEELPAPGRPQRPLRELVASGELLEILA